MGSAHGVGRPRPEPPSRLLRVRAESSLLEQLSNAEGSEAARLQISTWEPVESGEPVRVELSFGALADEVELWGRVVELHEVAPGNPRALVLAIQARHGLRLEYVRSVLLGQRQATARRCRRIDVDFQASWRTSDGPHLARVLDLSPRGAFVCSRQLPSEGSTIDLEVAVAPQLELHMTGAVSWLCTAGQRRGFGMMFRLDNRLAAERLSETLRGYEHAAASPSLR